MDWAKAKSILIAMFLILNILLLAYIINLNIDSSNSSELISDVKIVLSKTGVNLLCEIPNKNNKSSAMSFQTENFDQVLIASGMLSKNYSKKEISKTELLYEYKNKSIRFIGNDKFVFEDKNPLKKVDLKSKSIKINRIKSILKDAGIKWKTYNYFENEDGTEIEMVEVYKGQLIFDNYIHVKFTENGISSLTYSSKQIKNYNTEDNNVIPAYVVLLKNYSTQSNINIISIDLGFKSSKIDLESNMEASKRTVWRVRITESPYLEYFNSQDGSKLIE